eukprot:1136265_1
MISGGGWLMPETRIIAPHVICGGAGTPILTASVLPNVKQLSECKKTLPPVSSNQQNIFFPIAVHFPSTRYPYLINVSANLICDFSNALFCAAFNRAADYPHWA